MKLLKGKEVSEKIGVQIAEDLKKLNGYIPTLAIVRVGERPDDLSYERGATKKMASFGLKVKSCAFPADISNEEFLEAFSGINKDPAVDGILMLKPLPKTLDESAAEAMIDPEKDLDGISPLNQAKVFMGQKDGYAPCTAEAVIETLKAYEIPMSGKRVTVVGRSKVVGKPLAMLFLNENATVTVCHTRTKDLEGACRNAEIVAAAAGKAGMINASFVSEGAVVMDVGINVNAEGKLCGDVDGTGMEEKAEALTPVPGGIGTVTTAVLAKHLVKAAIRQKGN